MMQVTMTRADLIEKLKSQIKRAKVEDARTAKEHKKQEQAALLKFRDVLRKALKMDYKTAHRRYNGVYMEPPACPQRNAVWITKILNMIQLSKTTHFQIREGNDLHRAIMWMPESEHTSETVCD